MITTPGKTPRWFTALIIVMMLPIFQMPYLLSACPDADSTRTMLWIYPFYAIFSGYLAYQCYPQRHAMAWILIALLLLSHLSIFFLCTQPR